MRRLQEKVEAEVREAIPDLPSPGGVARIARNPVSMLNQLANMADARDANSYNAESNAMEFDGPDNEPSDHGSFHRRSNATPEVHAAIRKDCALRPTEPSLN